VAYLRNGEYEIDNNGLENALRPFALGRKNWLFCGSPAGAKAGAMCYTLIATAKANHLIPFEYLRYVFERIRDCHTTEDYQKLLPFNVSDLDLIKLN
jgi:transposase